MKKEALTDLIARWREAARAKQHACAAYQNFDLDVGIARLKAAAAIYDVCADDLEAALAAEPERAAPLSPWRKGEPPKDYDRVLLWDGEALEHDVAERCQGGWLYVYDDIVSWNTDWRWMPLPEPPDWTEGK
ncbi:MAG TPA: hypothetical protein VFH61_05955 [Thermoleophilia bacterium]|nr:hypothetical protein [Thermoleophilia bacterium]